MILFKIYLILLVVIFSSPVATVSSYEEFALKPKINEGIKIRQSFLFFRNRLYDLYSSDYFQEFKIKLSQ